MAHGKSTTTHFSSAEQLIHFLLKPRLWQFVSVYHQVITYDDYLVLSLYISYGHVYVTGVTTKQLVHVRGMSCTNGI